MANCDEAFGDRTEAVCVTGATGYIGSWLVRSLLGRGYVVHATARDTGKALQLFSSFGAKDRLKLFKADLRDERSFDEAVEGCVCLFHVAASMELGPPSEENTGDLVLSQILEPAIRGTTNLLKSCSRSRTIKRVIFTSSISTITAKDDKGGFMQIVDESSSIPLDPVWKEKPIGWTYILMKCLTEKTAFRFAETNGIDLISIIPPTVAGPFLTPTVPLSDQVLLSPITGDLVLSQILEPAIRGTTNLLKSCSRSRTIKRVIFTSSISTITAKDDKGGFMQIVDESSSIPLDPVWKEKPIGWTYILMKCLTEKTAFRFAETNGIDLISIIPPTVAGPFLTPTVPLSDQVLLSPITGDSKLYPILVSVHSRLGSIPLVHIEDICNAHIFLMEKKEARGRYICAAGNCTLPQLADILASEFPSFTAQRLNIGSFNVSACSVISSRKIKDLGFKFRYSIRDIVKETVSSCAQSGFLNDFLWQS